MFSCVQNVLDYYRGLLVTDADRLHELIFVFYTLVQIPGIYINFLYQKNTKHQKMKAILRSLSDILDFIKQELEI